MEKKLLSSMAGLLLAAAALPACAQTPTSASLEYGFGKSTQLARAGLQWNWDRQWLQSDSTHLGGYWDLTAANWHEARYQNQDGVSHSISDFGLTPVFRFEGNGKTGPYAEAAIGVHRLSSLYDNDGHQLATKFQFGDHLAVGYKFENAWEASLKLQHFSNGGIKHPNGGVNFLVLRVAKGF
ncbi:lipid A 3-O-deacylase [Oxalobacteraceae bacterium GrIS 1.11]